MRTSGVAVAVAVAAVGCFSSARYDTAHVQRVDGINARYDAESRRQSEWYASNVAALDRLRGLLVPVAGESPGAPLHRVDERDDIAQCRSLCAARGEAVAVPCIRDICQPVYADALIKTYSSADMTWVTAQLAEAPESDLESLLAFSHNQAIQRQVDGEAAAIDEMQVQASSRLELERQNEIRTSTRQRDADVAHARAAHRARVKAAAHTFGAMDRPVSPPVSLRGAETSVHSSAAECASHHGTR